MNKNVLMPPSPNSNRHSPIRQSLHQDLSVQLFSLYQRLFQQITDTTLVLTPNQRLARFLVRQYDQWQSLQAEAWTSLPCYSWGVWLQTLWDQAQTGGIHPLAEGQIMTPQQERLLWLQAIDKAGAPELLSSEAMAELAAQAWRSLKAWNQAWDDLPDYLDEVRLFKRWASVFQLLCDERQQLENASVVERLSHMVRVGVLPLPEKVFLVGFDEMSPAEQALCSRLQERGVQLETFEVEVPAKAERVEIVDRDTELRTAAQWAAALVAQNPELSIGIVIPDLAQLRPLVERIFTQVFEPQAILPGQARHAPGFNLSAAQPLAQTPLMSTALLALQLNHADIERDHLSQLLMSPFLWAEAEWEARLLLDLQLRSRYVNVPLTVLRAEAGDSKNRCPELHEQLQSFHHLMQTTRTKKQSFTYWATVFDQQVQALGWPGPRTLDTLEYQQQRHWPELLKQLAALDSVSAGPVSWQQAHAELSRLAYTPFHPETTLSPVQVLGMLEAAGQPFDYLWVVGLDDRVWPEPIKPNPLLPVDLQRQWNMPRASVSRELELATRLTRRLAASARQVIFSSPKMDGDQPLRPSPLVLEFPEIELTQLPQLTPPDYVQQVMGAPLEKIFDDTGPAILTSQKIRGGSQIFKNQAACPFRAFAVHRLHAVESEDLRPGISAPVRGVLLHNALEALWKGLKTQKALLALSEDDLMQRIEESIRKAWLSLEEQVNLGPRMKALESKRAAFIVRAWMELEKQRPPFKVVFQESSQQVVIGGIPLRVRYDRIDELEEGGGLVVLDYKTGTSDIKAWAGARPDEPQVPLYSILQGDQLKAAMFAQLHIKEVVAKGISMDDQVMAGLKTPDTLTRLDLPEDWSELLAHWRHTLERLAHDFMHGHAMVDPKHIATTCQFCELHSLCRVRMTLAETAEDLE